MASPPPTPDAALSPAAPDPEELLELIDDLLRQLHPDRPDPRRAGLDDSLERDLGLDSLTRVELLNRASRRFGISLPEEALAEVESPGDLLEALRHGRGLPRPTPGAPASAPLARGETEVPRRAETLLEVLDWHAEVHPGRTYLRLLGEEEPRQLTYGALRQAARHVARGIQERGSEAGRPVGIMLPTGLDYFYSFFGVLLAGGVPVPLYPPARANQLEDHVRRQRAILESAEARILVAPREAAALGVALSASLPELETIVTVDELRAERPADHLPVRGGDDLALLQYTSGSTGSPRGVSLSHANLLANIRAFCQAVEASGEDVFVSWLPLYHDMGLIGACLGTLYQAAPLVLMSPLRFLSRPSRWLRALQEEGGTLSAAPNFAFELSATRIPDEELEGLDLSTWRRVVNGAEPVSPTTIERFRERFEPFGYRPTVMAPCYGLAECAVGLTFPPPERAPVVDRIDRERFTTRGEAAPALEESPEEETLAFVGCGFPLPEHEVRVVDGQGREREERREGRIQFRGPSATRGYHRDPAATRELRDGDWLETGDRGYLAGGELHVTGRVKDVVIRAGRNIHPHELEEAAGQVEGVRAGRTAAFASRDASDGTERLVLAAETHLEEAAARESLRERLVALSAELLGLPADEVVLCPPGALLKTSSGKIRRQAVRARHEAGELTRGPRSPAHQLLRVLGDSLLPGLARSLRAGGASLWAAWFWLAFLALVIPAWLGCWLLPGLRLRWAVTRGCCRVFLLVTGIRARLVGREHFPEDDVAVLVANHASYADAVVLLALSPTPVAVVAKRELAEGFVSRTFFRGLGARFVERFDRRRAVTDASRVREVVERGQPLLFFPEGTFARAPGLLPFRMGAFLTAAEAGIPVVPVALRGTRDLLRPDQWYPRRRPVTVTIGAPLRAQGGDLEAAARLRDEARAFLLEHTGEPDLRVAGPVSTG